MVCCVLSGCTDTKEIPKIVFIVRTDISDTLGEMSAEEIAQQNIPVKSLGFYDVNGNYFISTDSELNALDNKTLVSEYEAGRITDKIQYHSNCDVDTLKQQYAKLEKIYRKGSFEIVYPKELPTVQAELSTWYGYYFDKDGNLQCKTIHREERMSHLYTDNDTVNEVYDWIIDTFSADE